MNNLIFIGKIVIGIILVIALIWPIWLLIWAIIKGIVFVAILPILLIWSVSKIPSIRRGYNPRIFSYTAEEITSINGIEIQLSNMCQSLDSANLAFDRLPKSKNGEVDLRYGGAREAAEARKVLPRKLNKMRTTLSVIKDAPHSRARKFVKPLAIKKGYAAALIAIPALAGLLGLFSWLARDHWRTGYERLWQTDPRLICLLLVAIAGACGLFMMRRFQFSLSRNIINDVNQIEQSMGGLPEWISGISGPIEPRLNDNK